MFEFKTGDKVWCSHKPYEGEYFYIGKSYMNPRMALVTDSKGSEHQYDYSDLTLMINHVKDTAQYTGGSSNYYKVFVKNPTTLATSYEAECNDIIEALKMTFAEGNAFKAIWRKAKARQGVQKKGYDNGLYDSEKVVFFGERMVVEAKSGEDK